MKRKYPYKLFFFITIAAILFGVVVINILQPSAVKAATITANKTFTIESNNTTADIESQVFNADFEFNAIAPSWKETNIDSGSRQFFIRTSKDSTNWTNWTEVDAIKMQKDGTNDNRLYSEFPIFATGKYFQYKISLSRSSTSVASPEVGDLKFNYMDSRTTFKQQVSELLSSAFTVHADSSPTIVSRADWGSPDPNGSLYKNDPTHYWPPVIVPVKQVFVHHTVDSDTSTDFSSVVRAIWQYHAITLGWGDIGYNYLIDPNGVIYEGRFGGDGVVAGHTLNYNTGSIGVALIGCYQTNNTSCENLTNNNVTSPSAVMIDSLTTLLAYKMTNYELDPTSTHSFCDYNNQNCLFLNMVAGHRDAYATACPGDLTYNILDNIRSQIATKKTQLIWAYSSLQIDYPTITIDANSSKTITIHFKNNGTSTWTNTGANRMILKTANPANHSSPYTSNSWIDSSTPAVLNETSVAPGSTGSFTITFSNPYNTQIQDYEYFQIVSQNNWTFKNYYTFPLTLNALTPIPSATVSPTTLSSPTPTPTPTSTPTPMPTPTVAPTPVSYKSKGDLNGDSKVDLSDLSILAANFGKTTSAGDLNGDGKVDITDLSILAANWGKNF